MRSGEGVGRVVGGVEAMRLGGEAHAAACRRWRDPAVAPFSLCTADAAVATRGKAISLRLIWGYVEPQNVSPDSASAH